MSHNPFKTFDNVGAYPGTGSYYRFDLIPALQAGLRFAPYNEETIVAIPNVRNAVFGSPYGDRDFNTPPTAYVYLPDSMDARDMHEWITFLTSIGFKKETV